ncbi:MAG: cytochrome ubiquinol oxidase subunit I [Candidatus Riflebacteria bacterium]|nr:cytochrome ubiquinol oxidase subunit I [Candidatus Riflebacteria bacterium]
MHNPWWYVPELTAPMVIAIVSVVHVLIAHYAVGGGLFLAVETTHAHRTGNADYLAYLKRHARFFVLLTVVLGAITGVGIWWTIGLASPLATRILIRTFVFAWATEYVCFLVEIVSAFVFYYYWERLPAGIHITTVWIYGLSAWASLVIIGAITAFMLDPGSWPVDRDFWSALLNRQALPQIISRTGGALLLSSLYVYLHAAITIADPKLHGLIESRSTRPALLGALMITAGGILWYLRLPESAQAALLAAPVLNVFMGLLFVATGIVFFLLFLGPYRNPGWIFTPGFAASVLLFGLIGFSTGEFVREAVRKPYIIYNVVLGSQMLPREIAAVRERGYLESGPWTRAFVQARHPAAIDGGKVDVKRLLALPEADRVELGAMIFQYHCNNCHAIERGYSPVGALIQGWTPAMIRALVNEPDSARFTMPPWSGTRDEAELLVAYLARVAPKRPSGMLPDRGR